ncbi:MAG TPA: hypothetical protein VK831_02930 [Candidatus Deferrimicrobiaceae bacterium]|nr:hypothetical protein [Candidatus Deferrimicrobiaceae bacterium]
MRKLLALVVAVAAVLAACGGQTATTNDPYELLSKSQSASWDRVQVDIGLSVTGPEEISIDPSALRIAVDTETERVNVHVAFPISALGDSAAELRQLGITGDSLEFDAIYDGDALYAKSPLGNLLAALMIQAGEIPTGDMTGWLKLLSKADFESMVDRFGGGFTPVPMPDDLPIPSAADSATLKATLEGMGVTLTYAGTESHNGVDAEKVTADVDLAKLADSDYFSGLGSDGTMDLNPDEATLAVDLWFDRGNSRLIGIDVHAASTSDQSQKADITINLHEPDAGVSFDAPASFVDVPLMEMISTLMETFGGGLIPQ